MKGKNRLQAFCQTAGCEPLPQLVQSGGKPGKIRYLRDSPFGWGRCSETRLHDESSTRFSSGKARTSLQPNEEGTAGWIRLACAHPSEGWPVDFEEISFLSDRGVKRGQRERPGGIAA